MRLGARHAPRVRRARDRPALGAAPPGARPGRARGAAAPQLATGVEHGPRHAQLRRGLRGQGVRQRVLRAGLPIVARGDGRGRGVEGRLAGGGAQGTRRAHVPRDAHPHLRRRHQRGAARHHRDGRPRHAAGALGVMDFALSPEQEALRELARRILADHVTHERLAVVEAEPDWFDRAAWEALAGARLLGTAIPEEFGGSGLGFLELCLLLEEVGRAVAPVPAWPTLVLGALPLARFGTRAQRAALLPAVASGEVVLTAALRMTAAYTAGREQFGRPIASFQAVQQRAADAYIDAEAIRLTTWQAAWRLAADRPATTEVAIAKFWASEAAHRVVYAAQHLHGGIGVDVDYPLHRYYLWSKQIELTLGSGP